MIFNIDDRVSISQHLFQSVRSQRSEHHIDRDTFKNTAAYLRAYDSLRNVIVEPVDSALYADSGEPRTRTRRFTCCSYQWCSRRVYYIRAVCSRDISTKLWVYCVYCRIINEEKKNLVIQKTFRLENLVYF